MPRIEFTVPGTPAPQGSLVRTPFGVRDASRATRPWRQAVAAAALEAMNGDVPLAGPVALEVLFRFPRPKSHYGTGRNAGTLKRSAPLLHSTKPDADKLVRAIGDALTGVVVRDDSQFAYICATKAYGTPGAVITITPELDGEVIHPQLRRTTSPM